LEDLELKVHAKLFIFDVVKTFNLGGQVASGLQPLFYFSFAVALLPLQIIGLIMHMGILNGVFFHGFLMGEAETFSL
jgi:hypothetical protein